MSLTETQRNKCITKLIGFRDELHHLMSAIQAVKFEIEHEQEWVPKKKLTEVIKTTDKAIYWTEKCNPEFIDKETDLLNKVKGAIRQSLATKAHKIDTVDPNTLHVSKKTHYGYVMPRDISKNLIFDINKLAGAVHDAGMALAIATGYYAGCRLFGEPVLEFPHVKFCQGVMGGDTFEGGTRKAEFHAATDRIWLDLGMHKSAVRWLEGADAYNIKVHWVENDTNADWQQRRTAIKHTLERVYGAHCGDGYEMEGFEGVRQSDNAGSMELICDFQIPIGNEDEFQRLSAFLTNLKNADLVHDHPTVLNAIWKIWNYHIPNLIHAHEEDVWKYSPYSDTSDYTGIARHRFKQETLSDLKRMFPSVDWQSRSDNWMERDWVIAGAIVTGYPPLPEMENWLETEQSVEKAAERAVTRAKFVHKPVTTSLQKKTLRFLAEGIHGVPWDKLSEKWSETDWLEAAVVGHVIRQKLGNAPQPEDLNAITEMWLESQISKAREFERKEREQAVQMPWTFSDAAKESILNHLKIEYPREQWERIVERWSDIDYMFGMWAATPHYYNQSFADKWALLPLSEKKKWQNTMNYFSQYYGVTWAGEYQDLVDLALLSEEDQTLRESYADTLLWFESQYDPEFDWATVSRTWDGDDWEIAYLVSLNFPSLTQQQHDWLGYNLIKAQDAKNWKKGLVKTSIGLVAKTDIIPYLNKRFPAVPWETLSKNWDHMTWILAANVVVHEDDPLPAHVLQWLNQVIDEQMLEIDRREDEYKPPSFERQLAILAKLEQWYPDIDWERATGLWQFDDWAMAEGFYNSIDKLQDLEKLPTFFHNWIKQQPTPAEIIPLTPIEKEHIIVNLKEFEFLIDWDMAIPHWTSDDWDKAYFYSKVPPGGHIPEHVLAWLKTQKEQYPKVFKPVEERPVEELRREIVEAIPEAVPMTPAIEQQLSELFNKAHQKWVKKPTTATFWQQLGNTYADRLWAHSKQKFLSPMVTKADTVATLRERFQSYMQRNAPRMDAKEFYLAAMAFQAYIMGKTPGKEKEIPTVMPTTQAEKYAPLTGVASPKTCPLDLVHIDFAPTTKRVGT